MSGTGGQEFDDEARNDNTTVGSTKMSDPAKAAEASLPQVMRITRSLSHIQLSLSPIPRAIKRTELRPIRMSSSSSISKKHNFVVYAPDKTDEQAFSRRMSVREEHLVRARKLEEAGVLSIVYSDM
jgi:hypothetical protein